jgi:hypothetical protein
MAAASCRTGRTSPSDRPSHGRPARWGRKAATFRRKEMDLGTRYLGLDLRHPIVASASPLTSILDGILRFADAGAAAIVMARSRHRRVVTAMHFLIPAIISADHIGSTATCSRSTGCRLPAAEEPETRRPAVNCKSAHTRCSTNGCYRNYLRAAHAYMLISMPTCTSTIFGVFQYRAAVHHLSPLFRRNVPAGRWRGSRSKMVRQRAWPGSQWPRRSAPGLGRSHRERP